MSELDRRTFIASAAAGAALLALPRSLRAAAAADRKPVYAMVDRQAGEALARLQEWIRQPSINATGQGMQEGTELMAKLARDAGFQQVELLPTTGASVVFGQLDAGAKRTLGLYFMYDVKHVIESEWSAPPFAAKVVELPAVGKVVMGRGTVNQKGPQSFFLSALHAIRGAGRKLPVNIVLIAEGEEEDGSPHLPEAVRRPEVQAALKRCQGVLTTDMSQNLDGTVDVVLGNKGIVEVELIADGARWGRGPTQRDIHSGMKPAVDSVAWHLVQALNTLVVADGNDPAIDGLESLVRPLTKRDKALVADVAKRTNEADLKQELSVERWARDLSFAETVERWVSRPTVNIQGLVGGYTGPAGKTIVPHHAEAKLDIRLVPDMTAAKTIELLRAHLAKRGFGDIEVHDLGSYDPTTTAYESLPVQAELAVYKSYGLDPLVRPRGGGSWPGYLFTGPPLNLPAIGFGMGYGLGAHSKDEFVVIEPRSPKVSGLTGCVRAFVDFLYTFAES